MSGILLVDNDALLKLSAYDLFEEALGCLHFIPQQVYILATAKYKLLPAKSRLKLCKEEEVADRLEAIIASVNEFSEEQIINPEIIDTLLDYQGIDAGEALLIAYAIQIQQSLLLTGDKKALDALTAIALENITVQLRNRICVLEVLFLKMIETDFPHIQLKVRSKPGVDTTMSFIFGRSLPGTRESALDGLRSHITHMKELGNNLLMD